MRLFIEPMEPLLFRDGRPFDAGQDNFATSLFPPTPETIQGAVRAMIASYWNPQGNIAEAFADSKLTQLIGDREDYGRFRVTGIALGRYKKTDLKKPDSKEADPTKPEDHETKVERLFPAPAHIVKVENSKQLLRLLPKPLLKSGETTIKSNLPDGISHILQPSAPFDKLEPVNKLEPVKGWLTENDLHIALGTGNLRELKDQNDMKNLKGPKDPKDLEIIDNNDIYRMEPRLGIGMQRGTKVTEEGFLYQVLMVRMNPNPKHGYTYGFVVDINLEPTSSNEQPLTDQQIQEALPIPSSGWMTLGGEQRPAHFRVIPTPESQPIPKADLEHKRALIYLATPASFDTGWKPSPKFAPCDKPITAAINRYESIGGWKLNPGDAGGEQKVMHRCVPAGSVYFFDKDITLEQPLTDYGMEIGYGITYKGAW